MSITLINAGPGSGKSFTLKEGFRLITDQMVGTIHPTDEQKDIFDYLKDEFPDPNVKCCFFSLNTSTRDDLEYSLPKGTPCFTFHGAGASVLTRKFKHQKLDYYRTDSMISNITGKNLRDMDKDTKKQWYALKKYVHYLKLEAMEVGIESLKYIQFKYPDMSEQPLPENWDELSADLLERCSVINGKVEFDDMLWLGMRKATQIYDIGFVDESQDVSNCAYKLVARLCKNIVFCGDRNQAINAFAGASEEMYDNIADLSDAILPLKMTLRNPPFIVEKANFVRPKGIIEGPNKGPGVEKVIDFNDLPTILLSSCTPRSTLIISRTNAAVIGTAMYLHRHKIPCQIVDKDLATEITGFFKQFVTQDITKLKSKLDMWENYNLRTKNPLWKQFVEDKAAYCREFLYNSKNWTELVELIKSTFEKHHDGFKLCSIHKSKGREAPNLIIINPPIELPVAMTHPIAREQEINLHFVALTRCAMNLYWVKKEQE